MNIKSLSFSLSPRYVKQKGSLRPFQEETIKAIKESQERLIFVEAPVGSGKSHIFPTLLNDPFFERRPLIFTYPTKILMEAQIGSMKRSTPNLSIYPPDDFSPQGINLFFYSSSSLVRILKEQGLNSQINRGELLNNLFRNLGLYGKRSAIVTSPDVLFLMVNKEAYRGSKRLQNLLQRAFVFFDEFHLYANLGHFYELLEALLDGIASKVVFLSATPYVRREVEKLISKYGAVDIPFDSSRGDKGDVIFNYPLEVKVCAYKYTKREDTLSLLRELIPKLAKPLAIIFDSVFRLRHLERRIRKEFGQSFDIVEWSGIKKDKAPLTERTVVLGTSAIEVGIDMDFKTLITEVSYWTSAIQRIGRVGRKSEGKVIILTDRDFTPYIDEKNRLSRDEFEKEILMKVLRDPVGIRVAGEMFRGDSYNFILIDKDTGEVFPYSQSIFAMYEVENVIDDWKIMPYSEKVKTLRNCGIRNREKLEELLLYDKLFPFWGVVEGRLGDYYYRVTTSYDPETKELMVSGKEEHIFYGG